MIEVYIRRPCSERFVRTPPSDEMTPYNRAIGRLSPLAMCLECGATFDPAYPRHRKVKEYVSFAEAERLAHSEKAQSVAKEWK